MTAFGRGWLSNIRLINTRIVTEWRRLKAQRPQLALGIAAGSALVVLVPFIFTAWFLFSLRSGLPAPDALGRIGEMNQATTILDARDQLAFTIFKEQRIEVPLAAVSPHVINAIVAIEDQQFYEHNGFNAIRIGLAALTNLRHGRLAQGGSTITQQLARLSFL